MTEREAIALATGSDPAEVCQPTGHRRVSLVVRIDKGACTWQDVPEYSVRRAKVFGLGDLFKEFGQTATCKEIHDVWMTCRICVNKRLHSRRPRTTDKGKGKVGKGKGKGARGRGKGKGAQGESRYR